MFKKGPCKSHSGLILPFKIECDDFSDEELQILAEILGPKLKFYMAFGVPTGGKRFAKYLDKYGTNKVEDPMLIVDDVLTTGNSMEEFKEMYGGGDDIIGIVIFSRGKCPDWVTALYQQSDLLK